MLTIEWIVAVILGFNGVLLSGLAWAYSAPAFASHRLSDKLSMKIDPRRRTRIMVTTSVLSTLAIFALLRLTHDLLMTEGPTDVLTVAWQAAAVLLVYDFAYYFLHRFMHLKRVMRWVHGVHHLVRNPSATESLFMHPAELFAGLALLFAATWVVGPVHIYAFAVAFLVYTALNVLVHSGLDSRRAVLRPIDFLAKKHHIHHENDFARNFSSLTPLPDLLFGTSS